MSIKNTNIEELDTFLANYKQVNKGAETKFMRIYEAFAIQETLDCVMGASVKFKINGLKLTLKYDCDFEDEITTYKSNFNFVEKTDLAIDIDTIENIEENTFIEDFQEDINQDIIDTPIIEVPIEEVENTNTIHITPKKEKVKKEKKPKKEKVEKVAKPKKEKVEKVEKPKPKTLEHYESCNNYHGEYESKVYTMFISEEQLDKINKGLQLLIETDNSDSAHSTTSFISSRLLKIKQNIAKKLN